MSYIEQAIRTESRDHFNVFSSRILHAALGLSTEVFELVLADEEDQANFQEELGDILWYIAVAADELKTDFESLLRFADPKTDDMPKLLIEHTGLAVNCVKKALYYGVEFEAERFKSHLGLILYAIRSIAQWQGYSLEEVQARNISKLARRYPERFTTERAVNRNVDEEMQVFT